MNTQDPYTARNNAIMFDGKIDSMHGSFEQADKIASLMNKAYYRAAAPELLEALKLALRKEPNETPGGFTKEWVTLGYAAIAKATNPIP